MVEKSIPTFILSRETGSLKTHENLNYSLSDLLAHHASVPLTPRMLLNTASSSEIIWLGSKENILIIQNSKGKIFIFDLISNELGAQILSANEKAVKLFFISNSLFMVTKPIFSESLEFFMVPLISLQNNSGFKEPILVDLKVNLRNLKEFCLNFFRIVIETSENIEVWDIVSQTKIETYQLQTSVNYQYTSGSLVSWKLEDERIKLNVLKSGINSEFFFETSKNIYFCLLYDDELVLGFENSAFVMLNLNSGDCRHLSFNMPKTIFCFEESQNFLAILRDGTGINAQEHKTPGFGTFGNCLACEMQNNIFVYGENGKLGVLAHGKIMIIGEGVLDAEQIGCNLETGQIFLACEGQIYVFE